MQPVKKAEVWCPKCLDYTTAPATTDIPPTAPPESVTDAVPNADSASLACGHSVTALLEDDYERLTRLKMKVARKTELAKEATNAEDRERHQSDKEALHEQINAIEVPTFTI